MKKLNLKEKNMETENKKILLAEDDLFLINIFTEKLSQKGFEVISAKDGQETLDFAENKAPDLILLDIFMPKINGLDVLEKIKKNEKTRNIPVIMLTNANEREYVEKARQMGADDYLLKASFTPQEVLEVVNKFLMKK